MRGLEGVRVLEEISARMLYSLDQGEVPGRLHRLLRVGLPRGVAQPKTVGELERIMRFARQTRTPVVPRGAASSAYGGVLTPPGALVLDLSWLRRIVRVDPEGLTATVEAGVRWSDLHRALEPEGLDIRSSPTNVFSTIGGWVATGGYGIGSTRYGPFKESVASMRVLLPGGENRTLTAKDPGFDLWFGSDGQLGVVHELTIRIRKKPVFRKPMLAVFSTVEEALAALRRIFEGGAKPYFGNLWTAGRMREKNRLMKRSDFRERPTLLLMVESPEDEAIVRKEAPDLEVEWKARLCWEDRFFPIRAKQLGPGLLASELVFPLRLVPDFLRRAEELGRKYGFEVVAECQIVGRETGVVIVTFLFDSRDDRAHFRAAAFAMKLTVTGFKMGGRPYNLGAWFSPFAERKLGDRYRRLRAYKRRIDPEGLFNPGKSCSRPFLYNAFLKAYSLFRFLPGRLRNPVPPAHEPPERYDARRSLDVCSRCAACVAHCPAVLAVGDERVSARGKLLMARWTEEGRLPAEEAQIVNLCMHCKYCTEVCQSDIRLEEAFFDLEEKANAKFGRPDERIRDFLAEVDRQGLMENLPMCDAPQRWVRETLTYDEASGQVSYTRPARAVEGPSSR